MSEHWAAAKTTMETGEHGVRKDDVTDDTLLVTSRLSYDVSKVKPLTLPIYHTSTYSIDSVNEYLGILQSDGYIYSRLGNPSVEQVECVVKVLEGAVGSMAFASGMAAVTTSIMTVCNAGDHIVCQNPIYSGTSAFLTLAAKKFGIEFTYVPAGCDVEEYRKAMKSNTRLLIGETPCNPLISILDLEAFGQLGHSRADVYTLIDATYSTPYLLKPITFGVDMVVHSATKFLGGHSDVLAGVVSVRTGDLWSKLSHLRMLFGGCMSPFDATLLSRGIKTLHVRMERHCDNADKIAAFLDSHEKVARVFHPSLVSHPNHEVAKRQMRRFGGMVAFEMKGGLEPARQLVEGVRVITLAVSLGGVESLIEHPATMTHGPMIMTDKEREEGLISDGLIRLSVGLEDADDLINDLSQALDKVKIC